MDAVDEIADHQRVDRTRSRRRRDWSCWSGVFAGLQPRRGHVPPVIAGSTHTSTVAGGPGRAQQRPAQHDSPQHGWELGQPSDGEKHSGVLQLPLPQYEFGVGQALPQVPQLCGSFMKLTHVEPQHEKPSSRQLGSQLPPSAVPPSAPLPPRPPSRSDVSPQASTRQPARSSARIIAVIMMSVA
jgi:hypothetical protein